MSSACEIFAFAVVQTFRPGVLLDGRQGGIILGNNLAQPHGENDFGIGKMAHDGAHAPLTLRGAEVQHRPGGAGGRYRNQFGSAPESFQ